MSAIPLTLRADGLSETQRASLAEWQANLERLVQQQRAVRARTVRGSLGVQIASAIRDAHASIAEVLAPAASALLDAAADLIGCYFSHRGDAREAAKRFGAFIALDGFLRGPKGDETLAALADQAERSAVLISRLLAGQVVWKFEGAK